VDGPVQIFRKLVHTRCARLRTLPFADLERLVRPRLGPVGETVTVGSRSGTIHTIVEPQEDGSLRVVLRGALQWRFIWFAYNMAMEGFYKHPDGSVTPMPDKEFREFD
jgi:hypothetical protein